METSQNKMLVDCGKSPTCLLYTLHIQLQIITYVVKKKVAEKNKWVPRLFFCKENCNESHKLKERTLHQFIQTNSRKVNTISKPRWELNHYRTEPGSKQTQQTWKGATNRKKQNKTGHADIKELSWATEDKES